MRMLMAKETNKKTFQKIPEFCCSCERIFFHSIASCSCLHGGFFLKSLEELWTDLYHFRSSSSSPNTLPLENGILSLKLLCHILFSFKMLNVTKHCSVGKNFPQRFWILLSSTIFLSCIVVHENDFTLKIWFLISWIANLSMTRICWCYTAAP